MNKEDLVNKVVGLTNVDRNAVRAVVDASTESIASALESRKPVMLIGFGTFAVAKRKARTVNHPRTGVPVRIDARAVPVFRPHSRLRGRIAAKRGRGRPRKK